MLPRISQAVLHRCQAISAAASCSLLEHGSNTHLPLRWLSSASADGQPAASTSGRPALPSKLLMRDFIQNSLYHPVSLLLLD